jgi:hypothetical protein
MAQPVTTSQMITRHILVDRTLSPEQVLEATGREQYTDRDLVKGMPRGSGKEIDVYFFNIERWICGDDLEKEYEQRGLIPADPYALAAVNIADPAFADDHPNGTHWKDTAGKWCFAAFARWNRERGVSVDRYVDGWYGIWWFAGVRK